LNQANTHGTPDTNASAAALHHTIGTGSFNAAAGDHKYHAFSNGQYFFDDYNQPNYLRLFTENAAFSATRFSPISTVEYWDDVGLAWVPWVGGDIILKNMLDGNPSTAAVIDHTHRNFRFIISKSTGWPGFTLVSLTTSYCGIGYQPATISIEECSTIGGVYALKETCIFGAGTTGANFGIHVKASSLMSTGLAYSRVEFDITDWVDNASYVTYPLRSFDILSNYGGTPLNPFTWDYDKKVTFPGALVSGVQPVVLNNDTRLVIGTIAAGTDLNTMTTTGKFQQPSNVNATLLLNYPVANAAGLLEVSTGYTYQRYTTYQQAGDRTFVRGYYPSTWNPWVELAKVGHTQSADTITDGTTNKAFLATERTKLTAITGTNTGDQTNITGNATSITGAITKSQVTGLTADIAAAMLKSDNLSGLADSAIARQNLGLGYAAQLNLGQDVGTVAQGSDPRFDETKVINTQREGVQVVPYGGASVGDQLPELQAAANKARDQNKVLFIVPGDYRVQGTLILQSSVHAPGVRLIQISGGDVCLQLGVRGVTLAHKTLHLPHIVTDGAALYTGIGVQVIDMDACNVWIPFVEAFNVALHVFGDGQATLAPVFAGYPAGISYNTFTLGELNAFTTCIDIDCTSPGWVTQNTFIGGRLDFIDAGPTAPRGFRVPGTRTVRIGRGAGTVPSSGVGNSGQNTFIGCSFEGEIPEYEIDCWDQDNIFLNCRFEAHQAGAAGGNVWWHDNGVTGLPGQDCGANGNMIIGGREANLLNFSYSGLSWNNTVITGRQTGNPSGAINLPGMTFQTDMDSGFYQPAANQLAAVVGGTDMLYMDVDKLQTMYRGTWRTQTDVNGFSVAASTATTQAGAIRLIPGAKPTVPFDGAMWTTAAGLFVQINGSTVPLDDTGWNNAVLATGWTVFNGETPGYRRISGVTYLRGRASTTGASANAFTLPVGFRPAMLVIPSYLSVVVAYRIQVAITGGVGQPVTATAVTDYSFSAVPSFPVA
jgi:hypothetical protein